MRELEEKLEAETKIGDSSEIEAKNLQEEVEEVIKPQETAKQIAFVKQPGSNNGRCKKMTATYADVSKVKETVNETKKEKKKTLRSQRKKLGHRLQRRQRKTNSDPILGNMQGKLLICHL